MRKPLFLLYFSFVLVFVSCNKNYYDDKSAENKSMKELKIQSGFNWKTTIDYNFSLISPITGIVELTDDKGNVYYKAMLTENQEYTFKLTLPSVLQRIIISIPGKTETIVLETDNINLDFTKQL
jgi:hypothetical protein